MVFGIFWVRTLKLSHATIKNWKNRLMFDDLVPVFDTFVRLFVGFWQSRIIFPNETNTFMFQFYVSRGGSWEKKSPTNPDWLWSHLLLSDMCSKSIGSFLVRTASQSQRAGSIINMKSTQRDRSKASINKGLWIVQGNGSWDVMTPSVRKSSVFPRKEKAPKIAKLVYNSNNYEWYL